MINSVDLGIADTVNLVRVFSFVLVDATVLRRDGAGDPWRSTPPTSQVLDCRHTIRNYGLSDNRGTETL